MAHPSGLTFEVRGANGQRLPVVEHLSSQYVVAQPGEEFSCYVHRAENSAAAGFTTAMIVSVQIDGADVGYSRVLRCGGHTTFQGWLEGTDHHTGILTYRAFEFAKNDASAGSRSGVVVQHPDDIKTGRIRVSATNAQGDGRPSAVPHTPKGAGPRGDSAALPETKKFFLNPSLSTQRGQAIAQRSNWVNCQSVGPVVWEAIVRYETADTLVLRGILNVANAAHRPLLGTCTIPTVVDALRGDTHDDDEEPGSPTAGRSGGGRGAAAAPAERQASQLAAVKRERSSGGRGGPAAVVDLTASLTLPGGRVVARDEVATCNLVDSDDEEQWTVQKKTRA